MLELPETIRIFDVARNADVDAKLIRLTRKRAAMLIDGQWWKIDVSKRLRRAEGDHHWIWRKQVGAKRNRLVWQCLAIRSTVDSIEGAIIYRIDYLSAIEPNQGAVYVDRIAVAPRNRDWLIDPPRFRGIGTDLMLAAVRDSYSLGLGGRVALTSLPTQNATRFYEKKGFRVLCRDGDGMIDYELPADKAVRWLEEEGCI